MNKRSIAAKKRIGNKSERIRRMSEIARKKWQNMSIEDRRNHALKMVKARIKNES